ncbi:MAG: hypothetical protein JNL01_11415 [Bdellovibrionales bacterium]|nr:hypothetical protein [Bdellovibrionales bacterium]
MKLPLAALVLLAAWSSNLSYAQQLSEGLNLSVTRMASNPKVSDWSQMDEENVRDHFEALTKKKIEQMGFKVQEGNTPLFLKADLVKKTTVKGSFWFYEYSLTANLIPTGQMDPVVVHTATYQIPGTKFYSELDFQDAAKALSSSLTHDVTFWLAVERKLNSK